MGVKIKVRYRWVSEGECQGSEGETEGELKGNLNE